MSCVYCILLCPVYKSIIDTTVVSNWYIHWTRQSCLLCPLLRARRLCHQPFCIKNFTARTTVCHYRASWDAVKHALILCGISSFDSEILAIFSIASVPEWLTCWELHDGLINWNSYPTKTVFLIYADKIYMVLKVETVAWCDIEVIWSYRCNKSRYGTLTSS